MFASKDLFFTNSGGYKISRSVRLRSSASAYLARTFNTPTNEKIWTWSAWVKRGALGSNSTMFSASTGASPAYDGFRFNTSDQLQFFAAGAVTVSLVTAAVFRDPSAWYHIVLSYNATTTTVTIYVNGVAQTTTGTTVSNTTYSFNHASTPHYIGGQVLNNAPSAGVYFDGYMAEVNFIDGQALTPSSFGQNDSITGVWQPKKYSGTYGTNGFYLNFSDNSAATAAAIGKDSSGNGNNWTPNNISVTAGATYDSMLDVPTNYADGGNGRGNYAVLNPVDINGMTISSGNLNAASTGATWKSTRSSISMSSGKWYWEITVTGGNTPIDCQIGIGSTTLAIASYGEWSGANPSVLYNAGDGSKYVNGTNSAYGASYTTNDVIGVAFDADALTITFYKNNTSQGTITTGWSAGTYAFELALYGRGGGTTSAVANFGQRPFTYTPPSGFVALNTQNLPDATIKKGSAYMYPNLWTGNGASSRSFTGWGFAPDLIWIKGRSGASDNALIDAVRGTGLKVLESNLTDAENGYGLSVTSFDSDGFTGATGSINFSYANTNSATYVGWGWKAGGAAVTNNAGSISSQVSANPTAGFSVVTYTGTGANATVGHGLGVAPKMIIVKERNAVSSWIIAVDYGAFTWSSDYFQFDTGAKYTNAAGTIFRVAPTSSVFSVGTNSGVNGNTNTLVAYCFAAVAGYSAFGSYTGNGSADGPFVFTNFQPRWVMVKRTDSTSDWYIWDTSRDTYNVETATLLADTSGAETSATSIDGLSNGFKCRSATVVNASGGTYIYAAFASPFKLSLAR